MMTNNKNSRDTVAYIKITGKHRQVLTHKNTLSSDKQYALIKTECSYLCYCSCTTLNDRTEYVGQLCRLHVQYIFAVFKQE